MVFLALTKMNENSALFEGPMIAGQDDAAGKKSSNSRDVFQHKVHKASLLRLVQPAKFKLR